MNLQPTTPEQRRDIYKDVEALLIPGFLAETIQVRDNLISLRTLYPSDLFFIRHRATKWHSARQWKQWIVATAIWMVDGEEFVERKDAPVKAIYESLGNFPPGLLDRLFVVIQTLNERVHKASKAVEAFCYETHSRFLWKSIQGAHDHLNTFGLGSNAIQNMWVAYNSYEDERIAMLKSWEDVKFIVSPHAPRGIKKLNTADKSRAQQEDDRRQAAMDRAFYIFHGLVLDDGTRTYHDGVRRAITDDELSDEMRRWVVGEMDDHDRIVKAYKDNIRRRLEEERAVQEERLEALRQIAEAAHVRSQTHLVGYSQKQLQELLAERQDSGMSISRIHDRGKIDVVAGKYLYKPEAPGNLRVMDNQIVDDAPPGASVDLDEDNLSEAIARRSVQMTTGPKKE